MKSTDTNSPVAWDDASKHVVIPLQHLNGAIPLTASQRRKKHPSTARYTALYFFLRKGPKYLNREPLFSVAALREVHTHNEKETLEQRSAPFE